MSGWPGWEQAVLQGIGAPITHENVAFLQHWAFKEAGTAAYNPLNTTQFATGATNYNTFGDHGQFHVRNYPNEHSGLAATIQTLQNGRFNHILQGLQSGNPLSTGSVNVARELNTWGTIHFAEELSAGTWSPPPYIELNDIEIDNKGNWVDSRTGERGGPTEAQSTADGGAPYSPGHGSDAGAPSDAGDSSGTGAPYAAGGASGTGDPTFHPDVADAAASFPTRPG
jgi:hypothetical protein